MFKIHTCIIIPLIMFCVKYKCLSYNESLSLKNILTIGMCLFLFPFEVECGSCFESADI
jgi:hypothetical protein